MYQSLADITVWQHLGAMFALLMMVGLPVLLTLVVVDLLRRVFW